MQNKYICTFDVNDVKHYAYKIPRSIIDSSSEEPEALLVFNDATESMIFDPAYGRMTEEKNKKLFSMLESAPDSLWDFAESVFLVEPETLSHT
jgi:hypothetical protein